MEYALAPSIAIGFHYVALNNLTRSNDFIGFIITHMNLSKISLNIVMKMFPIRCGMECVAWNEGLESTT